MPVNNEKPICRLTFLAEVARELVARWGSVAVQPDGEDSAGRSKWRLQTPYELVERAIESASLLDARLRSIGEIDNITMKESDSIRYG